MKTICVITNISIEKTAIFIKLKKNDISPTIGGVKSNPKIFAGGDLAGCKGTVAWAARSGRDAANGIKEYLK